ncbi:TetR/AcrR family transcriptional regulator [Hoyosella sp. G463]|uniref:TetR/AcrR family transcriptional regulator n=1 Tax=Lolliginicoccus lacisalsi TaxID=2742202 RepID=A0A927PL86_9ACTN|nr:TetR family transcriptional regulator [Lolliginicoccus lacisalsi]MBD8505176.1 TetR/AcrR family transcriptional regulator [Lolliginicoccus lacisalsi]
MADEPSRKKSGRPRVLHEHDIVAAALAEGLLDATMPAVARRLGVSHSALYRYYADRSTLMLACIGQAVASMPWPAPEEPWRTMLPQLAGTTWDMLERYPGLTETMLTATRSPEEMTALAEKFVGGLVAQGFTPRDAILAIELIGDLTLTTFTAAQRLDVPVDGGGTIRDLAREDWVRPGVLSDALSDETLWHGRARLDNKVGLLIDGFAQRVS